ETDGKVGSRSRPHHDIDVARRLPADLSAPPHGRHRVRMVLSKCPAGNESREPTLGRGIPIPPAGGEEPGSLSSRGPALLRAGHAGKDRPDLPGALFGGIRGLSDQAHLRLRNARTEEIPADQSILLSTVRR